MDNGSGNAVVAGSDRLGSITAKQWLILLSVQLSSLLFGMTITLANVVLPQIRGALSATHDEIAWIITLNLVATAVATPTTGWLASRLGWRGVMFGGVAGFTLFSLLCGFANSLTALFPGGPFVMEGRQVGGASLFNSVGGGTGLLSGAPTPDTSFQADRSGDGFPRLIQQLSDDRLLV